MQLFDKANCVFGSLFVDDGCCNVSIKVSALPENWADKINCLLSRTGARKVPKEEVKECAGYK